MLQYATLFKPIFWIVMGLLYALIIAIFFVTYIPAISLTIPRLLGFM